SCPGHQLVGIASDGLGNLAKLILTRLPVFGLYLRKKRRAHPNLPRHLPQLDALCLPLAADERPELLLSSAHGSSLRSSVYSLLYRLSTRTVKRPLNRVADQFEIGASTSEGAEGAAFLPGVF